LSKLVVFIFLFSTLNILAATNHPKHKALTKNMFNQDPLNDLEKKVSKDFYDLLKLSKRGVIKVEAFENLLTDLKRSSTFKGYSKWPQTILKINRLTKLKDISSYCRKISQRDNRLHVEEYLTDNAAKICYKKVLRKFAQNVDISIKQHRRHNKILEAQISYFFKYYLSSNLKNLLSKFEKGSEPHRLYSKTISNYLVRNNVTPNTSLLSYMSIDQDLTSYLQTIDLNEQKTQKVFLKEFRKLTKSILKGADEKIPGAIVNTRTKELIKYVDSTISNQPPKSFSNSYLSFGKSLTRRKHYTAAQNVFISMLQHKTPNEKKALFELLWTYTYNKKYKEGLIAIKPFRHLYEDQKDSKLTFWIALAKSHNNEKQVAHMDFQKIIEHNPLSYYAILASKILSKQNKTVDTKSIYINLLKKNRIPASLKKVNHKWIKRAIAWGEISASTLLKLEIEDMIQTQDQGLIETHLTSVASELSKKENYLESFKIIYRFVDRGLVKINRKILKILFPIPFIEKIKNQPREFDPIIALSLIRQESGFNRFAKSRVGARGLMQLMPGTAKRFKRRLRAKQLYDSDLNISIGTKYFQNLMKMFNNNLVYSLAAYNAGENRVSDWQERDYVNNEESMLQNIENIPFLETRKYVKLIFRNIFFYKMLTEEPVKKDPFKLNRIYDIHVGFNK